MTSILKVDTIQTAAGGTPTAADLGLNVSGSVLQVVQAVKTDTFSTSTATTWVDIADLSVSITPSSSSSKILIAAQISQGRQSANWFMAYRLVRDGSAIYVGNTAGSRTSASVVGSGENPNSVPISYLDSPSATSLLTYKVQLFFGGGTSIINYVTTGDTDSNTFYRTASSITAIEIAG
jgi:hypothetical protein